MNPVSTRVAFVGLAVVLFLAFVALVAFADVNNESGYHYEQLTVTSGAVSCTATATGRTPVRAFISVEGGDVRYRYDGGGSPTPSNGHLAQNYASFALDGSLNVPHLCFIAVAGDATVTITLESQ